MQFQQLGVYLISRGAGIAADDRCNVFRQQFHLAAFVQYHLIDDFQDDVLQKLLIDRFDSAGNASVLQAAFTTPDDGFAASVVPVDAPEHFVAFATEDELGKAMVTAVAALASVGAGVHHSPAYQFFLHLHEDFLWNNGFMVALHIVLRNGAVVLDSGFAEEVGGVGLLKQSIADV